jgi:hypothetical protein
VVLATAEALSEHGRLAGKRSVCNAERPICRARHVHSLISMQFDTKEAALQHFFDLQLDTALVRRSSCKRLPYVFFECRKADRKIKGKRKGSALPRFMLRKIGPHLNGSSYMIT